MFTRGGARLEPRTCYVTVTMTAQQMALENTLVWVMPWSGGNGRRFTIRGLGFESCHPIQDGCHDFAPNLTRMILKSDGRTLK